MGKSTISMVIFNSELWNYQRVYALVTNTSLLNMAPLSIYPWKMMMFHSELLVYHRVYVLDRWFSMYLWFILIPCSRAVRRRAVLPLLPLVAALGVAGLGFAPEMRSPKARIKGTGWHRDRLPKDFAESRHHLLLSSRSNETSSNHAQVLVTRSCDFRHWPKCVQCTLFDMKFHARLLRVPIFRHFISFSFMPNFLISDWTVSISCFSESCLESRPSTCSGAVFSILCIDTMWAGYH
jgi:hypothetical protein